jgi:hypothetical protein
VISYNVFVISSNVFVISYNVFVISYNVFVISYNVFVISYNVFVILSNVFVISSSAFVISSNGFLISSIHLLNWKTFNYYILVTMFCSVNYTYYPNDHMPITMNIFIIKRVYLLSLWSYQLSFHASLKVCIGRHHHVPSPTVRLSMSPFSLSSYKTYVS